VSLEKSINSGKEKRKPYYKESRRVDKTCRNHGTDNGDIVISIKKLKLDIKDKLGEVED
jgi:hypothetical protein